MGKLLVSGASGNVDYEIIRGLTGIKSSHQLIAADYNIEKAKFIPEIAVQQKTRTIKTAKCKKYQNTLNFTTCIPYYWV